MSNYNSLKATIDANIKQNGNQEITGQILNSVLNAMVTTLGTGYQFAGVATIATNPGTPDAKVFYIANGKGTYEKFGGLEVTEDDVVVFYWDSSWHKVATGIASQEKLSELESEIGDGKYSGNGSNWVNTSLPIVAGKKYIIDVSEGRIAGQRVCDASGNYIGSQTTINMVAPIKREFTFAENGFLGVYLSGSATLRFYEYDSINSQIDLLKEEQDKTNHDVAKGNAIISNNKSGVNLLTNNIGYSIVGDVTFSTLLANAYVDIDGVIKPISSNYNICGCKFDKNTCIKVSRQYQPSKRSDIIAVVDDISVIEVGNSLSQYIREEGEIYPLDDFVFVNNGQWLIFAAQDNGRTTIQEISLTSINVLADNVVKTESIVNDIAVATKTAISGNTFNNFYLNAEGVKTELNDWKVVEYNVTGGKTYDVRSYTYKANGKFTILDYKGNIVKYILGTNTTGGEVYNDTITIPSDGVTLQVSGQMVGEGSTVTVLEYKYSAGSSDSKKWNGKKWACIGDSITGINDTTTKRYHDYISEATGISVTNLGIGGTGYVRDISRNSTFFHRLSQVPTDADVITIFGSGNDKGTLPIGEVTDNGEETICGWMNKTLEETISRFPTIPLGVITPAPWANNAPDDIGGSSAIFREYCEKLVQICARKSIPCLDLYHCSNLHPTNPDCRNVTFSKDNIVKKTTSPNDQSVLITADNLSYYQAHSDDILAIGDYVDVIGGVHPDETGHKLIAPKIRAFMEGLIL